MHPPTPGSTFLHRRPAGTCIQAQTSESPGPPTQLLGSSPGRRLRVARGRCDLPSTLTQGAKASAGCLTQSLKTIPPPKPQRHRRGSWDVQGLPLRLKQCRLDLYSGHHHRLLVSFGLFQVTQFWHLYRESISETRPHTWLFGARCPQTRPHRNSNARIAPERQWLHLHFGRKKWQLLVYKLEYRLHLDSTR